MCHSRKSTRTKTSIRQRAESKIERRERDSDDGNTKKYDRDRKRQRGEWEKERGEREKEKGKREKCVLPENITKKPDLTEISPSIISRKSE